MPMTEDVAGRMETACGTQDSCKRAGNLVTLRADEVARRDEFHFAPDCNGPPVPAGAAAPPNYNLPLKSNRPWLPPRSIRHAITKPPSFRPGAQFIWTICILWPLKWRHNR